VDFSVIDDTNEIGNLDQLTKEPAPEPEKKVKPDWVPAKFWDESKGEVLTEKMAQSYVNLESSHGRMANDLGTQRKLTDRLLDLKRVDDLRLNGGSPDPAKPALPQVKGTELLDDPAGVISRVVETVVQQRDTETAQKTAQQQAEERFNKFVTDHPDYVDLTATSEFQSWVQESPSRKRLSAIASRGDVDAADDLLVEFKSRSKQPVTDDKKTQEAAGLEAARRVGLENGGASNAAASTKTGKTYRRVDLLRLKQERPDDYYSESFQAEIIAAYNEGRVK
jgi:hypothetical protein